MREGDEQSHSLPHTQPHSTHARACMPSHTASEAARCSSNRFHLNSPFKSLSKWPSKKQQAPERGSHYSVLLYYSSLVLKKIYKTHKETGTCDPYIVKNASNKTAFEVTQILALENKKFKAVV